MQHFFCIIGNSPTQIFKSIISLHVQRVKLKEHSGVQGQRQKRSHAAGHKGSPLTVHLTYFVSIAPLVNWPLVYVSVVICI